MKRIIYVEENFIKIRDLSETRSKLFIVTEKKNIHLQKYNLSLFFPLIGFNRKFRKNFKKLHWNRFPKELQRKIAN